jgi:hypothetical protein
VTGIVEFKSSTLSTFFSFRNLHLKQIIIIYGTWEIPRHGTSLRLPNCQIQVHNYVIVKLSTYKVPILETYGIDIKNFKR